MEIDTNMILMVAVLMSALVTLAAVVVPAWLAHVERRQKYELRTMRMETFDEVLHKAQLADLARDCIAGRETWEPEPATSGGDNKQ